MYCSRQVSEAQEWARARESKREQEKTSERKRQRKRFAAGKGHKGPKRQKRRHWGDASRFYWHRRQKGRGRSREEPQQCRPFSPLEMPGGKIGRSSPLVSHLTANACALLLPSLSSLWSLQSLRLSPDVRLPPGKTKRPAVSCEPLVFFSKLRS